MIYPSLEPHQCLVSLLAAKRLAGVAPDVNLGHTPPASMSKAAHCGLQSQRRHHQKSKTGYLWSHKKDFCSPKKLFDFQNFVVTNTSNKYMLRILFKLLQGSDRFQFPKYLIVISIILKHHFHCKL